MNTNVSVIPEFLAGGGEMGARIREYNWAATPLGPVDTWPQSLRTCVRIMLTSRQPIWIGWGKELIKFYNDPYKAIVGGKHPWALGSPASVVWKDIWKDIEPMLQQVMQEDEGTYVESQLLIMERNGYAEETYYTFSYTPIPGDDGGTAGMICANVDNTDRIISERQLKTLTQLGKRLTGLQASRDVIQQTIYTLEENPKDFPFALFYTLSDNRATLVNATDLGDAAPQVPAEIDLETPGLGVLLQRAALLRQPQVMDGLEAIMGAMPMGSWTIRPGKAVILPIVSATAKEPYGFLVAGFNPYRLPDEKYIGFCTLIMDQIMSGFADVHLLEEERKRAAALAEIDRAKTAFFSNISHEFRTPLTLLLGPIEEALQNPAIDTAHKTELEIAYRNALRMQKLVNTLLEFSRIEAERVDGKFARVDICRFTEDLASTFRSAVEKAGMALNILCTDTEAEVYVDVEMWEKIVLNLLSNAFKYTNQGHIDVGVQVADNQVLLSVTDTGIGIAADQLDKIFDRFHRVENIQGRSQEGTGIGLAMVKELVKIHKGNITVSSRPGAGSTFTVVIPTGKKHLEHGRIEESDPNAIISKQADAFLQEAMKWLPEAPRHEAAINDTSSPALYTVLLADDNADMREYVQRLLAHQFRVITAVNGEEAFSKMLQYKPDLLLSDIMMPRLNGFGLLQQVRNHPDTRHIPVIFLSARAGEESKVEGLDAGADDYLVKPFSARELLARVEANIKIAKSRIAAENNVRNMILQSPIPMVLLRGDTFSIEIVNERALELWDRDHENAINKPLLEVLPELAEQGFGQILHEVYTSGVPYHGNEIPLELIRFGKPEQLFLNFIYAPLRDAHNVVTGIIAVGIDVSEQVIARRVAREYTTLLEQEVKNRTHELQELNIALQQSNEDLQQFAHVVSHDLKEPVRKIKTFSNRLQYEYGDLLPEKGRTFLDKVQHATERIFSMIEGVLSYSTLNAAEQKLEKVDLNKTLANIEEDLEVSIQQKRARIVRNELPIVEGASILIYQLFYNLINNSLKFARTDELPVIRITCSTLREGGQDYVEVAVTDNGIGFEQEYAKRIFDTFTRLNAKDKFEGTGLGLALCKKIVERHHGSITATGIRDEGAVFTILLPLIQIQRPFKADSNGSNENLFTNR
ncbi:ATP-binding protein [Chitinophaga sp. GbtcB8]|uniref:ATP-binding response regulator n=1 Tax=Chitinophaga sp. GbtcB8 TaxID=2824753 RepID=UPI001C2F388D|nr:ATP-binding protein [Chitinophaga sp. GbtcB8]